MQRVPQRQHVADRIGGRERHGHRADDAGVDERHREEHARDVADILAEPGGDRAGVLEVAEFLPVPANVAAANAIIATAPTITSTMPIHRSARS